MGGTEIRLEDIQKQAETIRKLMEDVLKIVAILDGDRSAVISLINVTDLTLMQTFSDHDSGGFAKPPSKFVAPRNGTSWGSQSTGFGRGAIGTVHYAGDGVQYFCDWNVPYWNSNHASTSLKDATGRYREWHVAGAGEEKVQFEYTIYQIPEQGGWRSCDRCLSMFFDRGPDNNAPCPNNIKRSMERGGGISYGRHSSTGWEYFFSHDYDAARNQMADWRSCRKCGMIFYDGISHKGFCMVGGGHEADGFNYLVPYVSEFKLAPKQQGGWRICEDCLCLFYGPWQDKGACAAQKRAPDQMQLNRGPHNFVAGSHDYALNHR